MLQDVGATVNDRLLLIYERLYRRYGPQDWWPAGGPFEVMVGAILTQSAAWTNVEKAIQNLKSLGVLSPRGLLETPLEELARAVYPSGYYNNKARKLKAMVAYIDEKYGGDLRSLFAPATQQLRGELLNVYGIGEETADSILLYAAERPVFVIDAYTRRIFSRLGLCDENESYGGIQAIFMEHLPPDAPRFNEYHALIVQHGKGVCRKRPSCPECCILDICAGGQAGTGKLTPQG